MGLCHSKRSVRGKEETGGVSGRAGEIRRSESWVELLRVLEERKIGVGMLEGLETAIDDSTVDCYISWVCTAQTRVERFLEVEDVMDPVNDYMTEGAEGSLSVVRGLVNVSEYLDSLASAIPLAGALVSVAFRLGKSALAQLEKMQEIELVHRHFKKAVGNLIIWLPRDFKAIFEIADKMKKTGDERKAEHLNGKAEDLLESLVVVFQQISAERNSPSALRRFFFARQSAEKMQEVREAFDEAALYFFHAVQEATREKAYEVDSKMNKLEGRVKALEDKERRRSLDQVLGILPSVYGASDVWATCVVGKEGESLQWTQKRALLPAIVSCLREGLRERNPDFVREMNARRENGEMELERRLRGKLHFENDGLVVIQEFKNFLDNLVLEASVKQKGAQLSFAELLLYHLTDASPPAALQVVEHHLGPFEILQSHDVDRHLAFHTEGTREWVLDEFAQLAKERGEGKRVLALLRNAGTGKSVASALLCLRLSGIHSGTKRPNETHGSLHRETGGAREIGATVVAYAFARHNAEGRNRAVRLLGTLSLQIARRIPEMAAALAGALNINDSDTRRAIEFVRKAKVEDLEFKGNRQRTSVDFVFEHLLLSPLKVAQTNGGLGAGVHAIVLDALDEIADGEDRESMLILVEERTKELPSQIKLFLTGRPHAEIEEALRGVPTLRIEHLKKRNHDDMCKIANAIVRRFISNPDDKTRASDVLVQKAGQSLLWFRLGAWDRLTAAENSGMEVTLRTVERLESGLDTAFEEAFGRLGHSQRWPVGSGLRNPLEEDSLDDQTDEDRRKRLDDWTERKQAELTFKTLSVLLALSESIHEKDLPKFVRAPATTVGQIFRTLSVFFAADADGYIHAAHKTVFDWALNSKRVERGFADTDRGDLFVLEASRNVLEREQFRTETEGGTPEMQREHKNPLLVYSFKLARFHLERINRRVGERHWRAKSLRKMTYPLLESSVPFFHEEIRKWSHLLVWPRLWGDSKVWDQDERLQVASCFGQSDVVAHLLSSSASCRAGIADVNTKGMFGKTPLHKASEKGHKEVAVLLLDHGAQADAEDDLGETALHHAAKNGHKEMAELLLERGAAVDAKDWLGVMPVYYAEVRGHADVGTLLLQKADANRASRTTK
uniref:Nephrocystin 3-like N-terminal domain-containing protein n=1 Tax=Chromera velia CCMP2878 TaxID=1169474 RepID=A0A0G4HUQ2_9ALVE|eukprot:Cvel_8697.t1-p1 / transcript=Cvel_8697.t1 / gene=Cvel_8697 / organism=Chromera_velia_CCMP2878 / gene_product=Ankyrin repeat domain-containing protein 65, putative / transcript_product=Ankyrin repeat domain-containing protein 65, putative / location=Cvel_scaffold485:55583-62777(+) / protein_length=1130 / sequence_SO=supercontig / SO=protein_coding / is_pseudo=false